MYNKEVFNEFNKKQTKEDTEIKKKIFQQKYSKLLKYCLFLEIHKKLKNFSSFYLGLYFDFRGIIYTKSCMSPMRNKIIKLLYFYGYYTKNELKSINIKNLNKT